MSAAGLSWISLSPSRERRAWLTAAAAISAVLAAVFLVGAWINADAVLGAGGMLAAGAAAWAFQRGRREPRAGELSIDADGAIWLRRPDRAENVPAQRLQPRLAGDRLVTFSSSSGPVVIWRDSLPADAFRRLSAHARWHVDRAPRQPVA
jgi:hypothetical protein